MRPVRKSPLHAGIFSRSRVEFFAGGNVLAIDEPIANLTIVVCPRWAMRIFGSGDREGLNFNGDHVLGKAVNPKFLPYIAPGVRRSHVFSVFGRQILLTHRRPSPKRLRVFHHNSQSTQRIFIGEDFFSLSCPRTSAWSSRKNRKPPLAPCPDPPRLPRTSLFVHLRVKEVTTVLTFDGMSISTNVSRVLLE